MKKPLRFPSSPSFGSGPCKKLPGYSLSHLSPSILGRSHRSVLGQKTLQKVIHLTKRLLNLPKGYQCGIVPGSATGAMEMALWNLIGPLPLDVFYFEAFGKGWYDDIQDQLKHPDVYRYSADYGVLPNFSKASKDHDILFPWNGTTSGVCVPNGDWIPREENGKGLVICDATSAALTVDLPWEKIDVCIFSWQKALGGEGGHGMLVLSPRAVERIQTFTPTRPIPKLFQLKTEQDGFLHTIFEGSTVNTPSMLCVEDFHYALQWAIQEGGMEGIKQKIHANFSVLDSFVKQNEWINYLCTNALHRSKTSVCLTLDLTPLELKEVTALLENEQVAYDIKSYRDAPLGLRIWCGPTVETTDLEILTQWIEWAYWKVKAKGT